MRDGKAAGIYNLEVCRLWCRFSSYRAERQALTFGLPFDFDTPRATKTHAVRVCVCFFESTLAWCAQPNDKLILDWHAIPIKKAPVWNDICQWYARACRLWHCNMRYFCSNGKTNWPKNRWVIVSYSITCLTAAYSYWKNITELYLYFFLPLTSNQQMSFKGLR